MYKPTTARKAVAVLLAVTVLLSCMVWSGVSAAVTDYLSYNFSYDDGYGANNNDYWNIAAASNTTYVSWEACADNPVTYTDEQLKNSGGTKKALHITYTDNNEAGTYGSTAVFSLPNNTGAALNGRNDGQTAYLPAGVPHRIAITYKADSLPADAAFYYGYNFGDLRRTSFTVADQTTELICEVTEVTDGWVTKTGVITPPGKNGFYILLLSKDNAKRSGTDVTIGGITVSSMDTADKRTVTLKDISGTFEDYVEEGVNGDTIDLSVFEREDHDVAWYTDEACTTPFTDTVFTDDNNGTTLYAKRTGYQLPAGVLLGTQTFETGTLDNFTVNPAYFTGVTADENHTQGGTNSLKTTVKKGWNAEVGRPRIAIKLGDATTAADLTVKEGYSYNVSFWVRASAYKSTFQYYLATMGASDLSDKITATTKDHVLQTLGNGKTTATATLSADQWTQIVATVPSVVLDDANDDNCLVLGYTFTDSHTSNFSPVDVCIDDIAVYQTRTVMLDTAGGDPLDPIPVGADGTVTLPEPYRLGYTYTGWYTDAACTNKVTSPYTPTASQTTLYTSWEKLHPQSYTYTQDLESVDSMASFSQNTQRPYELTTEQNHTPGGSKALKTTMQTGYNGNFKRPLWALQMNGETAPMQVEPGFPLTVTFSVMAERNVTTVNFMLDTVNDLAVLNNNPGTSSQADAYRTMQTMSSLTGGTLANDNTLGNLSLKAGEWTTVTATIPAVKAQGDGTQYLVLAIGDSNAYKEITPYALYVDDISVEGLAGGHTTNVIYNTMGGDSLPNGRGIIWSTIETVPTRAGYAFDGWFTEESCQNLITTYPCQETVTLYAGWHTATGDTMTFEVDGALETTTVMDMDLDDAAVVQYASGSTASTRTDATNHAVGASAEGGSVMQVTVGTDANSTSKIYGFRMVGKDTVDSGYKVTNGQTYALLFRYKVEAMPVATEIRVLEGSINWTGSVSYNSRVDHPGFMVSSMDEGAGWQEGVILFTSKKSEAIHLALHASDYTRRSGTTIYFDDIRLVQNYRNDTLTTTAGADRVEGEQNKTAGGKAALKIADTAPGTPAASGRVLYGNARRFLTDTVNTVNAWLYSPVDTEAKLQVYSELTLDGMDSITAANLVAEATVTLKAGQWMRVQKEFCLPSLQNNPVSYLSLTAVTSNGGAVYMDDISVSVYTSDPYAMQTYEEVAVGTHPNTDRFDGNLHGYYGNTVVSGIGYNGSDRALEITMQSDVEQDISRAVLFTDKSDVTARVGSGYLLTFYAMAQEDREVTFALGTSETIDLSQRETMARPVETEAITTVAMQAGTWVPVSVYVQELLGLNSGDIGAAGGDSAAGGSTAPYITLGAWFKGAAADNTAPVYIDNVTLQTYTEPGTDSKSVLCFEDTEAFGFGKQLNIGTNGSMEVVAEQNHSNNGYYSLKVTSTTNAGATRPQFNLLRANAETVRVKEGKNYKVSFWVYLPEDAKLNTFRYWLAVTDLTEGYTAATNQQRLDETVNYSDSVTGTRGGWKQVSLELKDIPKDGYLRLGLCGTAGERTVLYVDDIFVTEIIDYVPDSDKTVLDMEDYNLEDNEFIRYGTGYVTDKFNHTDKGERSLYLKGISRAGATRNQLMLVDPTTHELYECEINRSYTVTFWMYCPEEYTSDFQLNVWAWGTDDPTEAFTTLAEKNDKNGTYEVEGVTLSPISDDGYYNPGEWNQYSISFTAKNGKYMLIGLTDDATTNGGYEYYIDDIEITIPTPAVVTYDPNGGAFSEEDVPVNDRGQYVEQSAVGFILKGPAGEPFLEGKRFDGWALDKEGKQPFDLAEDTVTGTTMTLYAVWGNWDGSEFDQIDRTDPGEEEETTYRTEIRYEKVWTGNAKIPTLTFGEDPLLKDAPAVDRTPPTAADDDTIDSGLPVWLLILIIVAAVVIVGGGALLALLLMKRKKSPDEKEVA